MSAVMALLLPMFVSIAWLVVLVVGLLIRPAKSRGIAAPDRMPNVTVMIPHYNEDIGRLLGTLEAIDTQRYTGRMDILLVDDGSTNQIQSSLASWVGGTRAHAVKSIVLDRNTGRKGKALDEALACLPEDTEVVVIVDSDTIPFNGAMQRLVEHLWSDPGCAVACGYLVPCNPHVSAITRMQYREYTGPLSATKLVQNHIGRVPTMAGAFSAHRRKVIEHIGGWGRWSVEDMAWTWKALAFGYGSRYVVEAVALTRCPESVEELNRQRRRWSRGHIEAYGELLRTSPMVAVLMFPFLAWHVIRHTTLGFAPFNLLALCWIPTETIVLFAAQTVLYLLVAMLHVGRSANPCAQDWRDAIVSSTVGRSFRLWLWWPGVMGIADAVRGGNRTWLTRGLHDDPK
ncbi:biofilm PGA synthesis N-glycosyltransferase PgaC [Luteibacter sp. W1I16]|uniref:glycosyltransferase n=1 Tax=Luteibacter sp. W1I16 TaxID=3373922 RepID=UPI003D1DDDBC